MAVPAGLGTTWSAVWSSLSSLSGSMVAALCAVWIAGLWDRMGRHLIDTPSSLDWDPAATASIRTCAAAAAAGRSDARGRAATRRPAVAG